MATGVFAIPRAALIDRELRCRGTTLDAWADAQGVPRRTLHAMLEGAAPADPRVLAALAETLGVSVAVLETFGDAAATSSTPPPGRAA